MRTKKNVWAPAAFIVILALSTLGSEGVARAEEGCERAPHYLAQARFSKESEKAVQLCLEAVELCPGYIRAYEILGNLYRKEGRNDLAVTAFTKAAELGSRNYKLYHLLASLLFESKEYDEAHRHIMKSLSIQKDYGAALELKEKIEGVLDREGPKITMLEPAGARGLSMVLQHDNLSVRGIATDKSGVAWVKVNRLEASIEESGHFLKDIPVQAGKNTLFVEAADRLGNKTSLSIAYEREGTPVPLSGSSPRDLYGKSFAVVIGVNDYEKWPPLEFAVQDARSVEKRLRQIGFEEITTILDKQATQGRILTELFHNLPKRVGVNDRVLFFFAGHGQTEDLEGGKKRGYIIPADGDTAAYASTAISMEQVRSLSGRIRAKHILFVMDSCYSGLGVSRAYGTAASVSGYLRKVASMRAVQIVTAGGSGEQAQERGGQGLFTGFFLKALEGEADLDKDGVVTGTEIGAYIRPVVSEASNQAQTPLYGRLEGEGEFLFFIGRR
ncbi:MAG: hypothetical protein C4576_02325 [Desulfobacteraceae bacterium]|nr:MAG: hypothetical protein C4576_02325 [Desulfobacteraceae bacterium]